MYPPDRLYGKAFQSENQGAGKIKICPFYFLTERLKRFFRIAEPFSILLYKLRGYFNKRLFYY